MRKFILSCTAVIMMTACTGTSSTKVSKGEYRYCLICDACDSLEYYTRLDAEAYDSTWTHIHSDNFNAWYDFLTLMVCDDLYSYPEESVDSIALKYKNCPKFMNAIDDGWDGICGDCHDTLGVKIDRFYDIINK